jgi:hypothetical protein
VWSDFRIIGVEIFALTMACNDDMLAVPSPLLAAVTHDHWRRLFFTRQLRIDVRRARVCAVTFFLVLTRAASKSPQLSARARAHFCRT